MCVHGAPLVVLIFARVRRLHMHVHGKASHPSGLSSRRHRDSDKDVRVPTIREAHTFNGRHGTPYLVCNPQATPQVPVPGAQTQNRGRKSCGRQPYRKAIPGPRLGDRLRVSTRTRDGSTSPLVPVAICGG